MEAVTSSLLGVGIYTVQEASRLTGVSVGRIRRWLRGYNFRTKGKRHHSPRLWEGQHKPIDHAQALGFLDLIEIKFVDAFLSNGVSWVTLRKARERARELFGETHPFCSQRFATDGHEIFVELQQTGEPILLEIARNQEVFVDIVKPFFKELEFDKDHSLVLWRPATQRRLVVLDPSRNFGRPIVARRGIPTEALAQAAKASGSVAEVSRWYEVSEDEIKDAVEFEQKLAA
ncbi:MAG: DUF433 domain-containing protein [Verrucomicrobiota bacterium]